MSSNYPPGVTGREYAIAGAEAEIDQEVVCKSKDIEIHNLPSYGIDKLMTARATLVKLTTFHFPPDEQAPDTQEERRQIAVEVYRLLEEVGRSLSEGATVNCPFEGLVTVSWYGGIGTWTCPCCGAEYEIEAD